MKIGFVNFTPIIYNVETPYHEPLGGSESALCYLAEALSKRKHKVTLFGRLPNTFTLRGVKHEPAKKLQNAKAFDLDFLIIQNTPEFGIKLKALLDNKTKLIFWTEHATDQPAVLSLLNPSYWQVFDSLVFISNWQMENYIQTFKIHRNKCIILRNAISPAFEKLFPETRNILLKKSNPPILVYTSTPFRGLELLIELFPKIRKEIPNTILKVFSSMKVYQSTSEADEKTYGRLYSQCRQTEGVKYYGSISQTELAKELQSALVLAYPNTFPETSCISIMEAMSAGCQVITSNLGALPETAAGFAKLIPMNNNREKYCEMFVDETVAILKKFTQDKTSDLANNLFQQVNFTNNNYTWNKRAIEWEKLLHDR